METLLIRLIGDADAGASREAEWIRLGSDRKPRGDAGHGALEEAQELAAQRRVVVLVPSEDVSLTCAHVQARNREQLARAVPYALEEDLAEDVEQLHFALGGREKGGEVAVAVVAHERMTGWLERLHAAGIAARAMIADLHAIPLAVDGWSLLLEGDRALLRMTPYTGYSVDPHNLQSLLTSVLNEAVEAPPALDVYRCEVALPCEVPLEYNEHEACPPELLASGLDEKRAINLLQGPYRVSSEMGRLLKPWRAAAALLGVWIVAQGAATALELKRLGDEHERLQAEIERVYRDTFPQAQRVVNPRVQMEQRLRALQDAGSQESGDGGFMPLLDAGGAAVKAESGLKIDTLDYRKGQFSISLTAGDLQSLEALKRRLREAGYDARIDAATTRGSEVSGRLLIEERAG